MTVELGGKAGLLRWQEKSHGDLGQPAASGRYCAQVQLQGCYDTKGDFLSVKLKGALYASANTGMCMQGILWRKMVSTKQSRSCKVF